MQAGASPDSSLRVSATVDAVMPSATQFLLAKLNQQVRDGIVRNLVYRDFPLVPDQHLLRDDPLRAQSLTSSFVPLIRRCRAIAATIDSVFCEAMSALFAGNIGPSVGFMEQLERAGGRFARIY